MAPQSFLRMNSTFQILSGGPLHGKQGKRPFLEPVLKCCYTPDVSVGNLNRLRSSIVQKHMWPDRIFFGTGKQGEANAEMDTLLLEDG
jgi:hypothetical protein